MKRLCIIPARGGSKRLPRKNIKLLCGKPLVFYTIDAVLKSKIFDKVIFTSDDDEVKEGIRNVGDIKQNASKEIGHFKHELGTKKIDSEYTYGLRYEEFISPIIKAIQELAIKVKALEDA